MGATKVEELLKKALDEIAVLKAENAQLRQENALLKEALAMQKKNSGKLIEASLVRHRKTAQRAQKERETKDRGAKGTPTASASALPEYPSGRDRPPKPGSLPGARRGIAHRCGRGEKIPAGRTGPEAFRCYRI